MYDPSPSTNCQKIIGNHAIFQPNQASFFPTPGVSQWPDLPEVYADIYGDQESSYDSFIKQYGILDWPPDSNDFVDKGYSDLSASSESHVWGDICDIH